MAREKQVGEVGEMLRSARSRSGLSVRQLAPLVRKPDGRTIGPSYVTDIEQGRGIPSDFIAQEFARVLKMDSAKFLEACRNQRNARAR